MDNKFIVLIIIFLAISWSIVVGFLVTNQPQKEDPCVTICLRGHRLKYSFVCDVFDVVQNPKTTVLCDQLVPAFKK